MTALELLAEQTPRSPTTIGFCRDDVAQSARRFTKRVAIGFTAFGALMVIIFGSVELSTEPDLEVEKVVGSVIMLVLLLVVLPAWVVGKIAMRDAKTAARLARDGTAYRAAVVRRVSGPGIIPYAVLTWNEGDRRAGARFGLTNAVVLADPEEIVVLAHASSKTVVAVFGDRGMQLGRRTRLRGKELS